MEKMKIAVWSDIACPYCYIGKHRLEKALEHFPYTHEIEIEWKCYELNPSLPKQPSYGSSADYIAQTLQKTPEDIQFYFQSLTEQAKEVGLEYHMDQVIIINTCDALRLIKLAASYRLANQMEELLFRAYFTEGKNIGDHKILVELGEKAGLKKGEIVQMLESDLFLEQVQKETKQAESEFDLQYIPFYVFNNRDIIQGSLPINEYIRILNKAHSEWKSGNYTSGNMEATGGKACSIDGVCEL